MAYTKVEKPTATYNRVNKPYPLDNFLLQDGSNFLFQNGDYIVFEKTLAEAWSKVVKPT